MFLVGLSAFLASDQHGGADDDDDDDYRRRSVKISDNIRHSDPFL